MSKEIESISSALFDKIRSRFPNVTLGDEKAKAATDPTKARFFNFTYAGNDGAEFGNVTISLIDETSLKVYFGQNISGEMDREQRKEWYEFLRNLRQFAKRNLLTFDTRDINKSNLALQDIKQQSKADDIYTVDDVSITESRLYGTPGRPYNSFADEGNTKILIRHKDKINDEVRGARGRKIESIFLETERGERFLLDHTNLHGARAMACHLNHGGSVHDERADHINELVAEMATMSHFVRSTKRRQFEDQETADMTKSAVHRYEQLKRTLRHLGKERNYDEYFETLMPSTPVEEEVDVDSLRERFVKKIYDNRFNDALPYVYRAYKKQKANAGHFGTELEEWADEVTESTWAMPDDSEKVKALVTILQHPVPVGLEGIDATSGIEKIIGDDDLFDEFYHLSQSQGPDADATPLIKKWLNLHSPKVAKEVELSLKSTGRDQQTNWVQPVSPTQPKPDNQYGATTMDDPVTESDSLNFLRSLAGIKN